jgi:DNA gyrase subunit A
LSDDHTIPPSGNGPEDRKDGVAPVAIEDELRKSYLDYAMSVIVSRALPDARDGLKPVHRRIVYSMYENGQTSDKKHVKSANIVGAVMGQYHPHGDQAIYDALVRMAQPFSMNLLLVDGQGNFGSVDGDPPAAMRYTESRMTKAAEALIDDIDKGTVDFQPNYDGARLEPVVLPARYPNLLVNGAGGIAVGMATNIPPHNLGEIIDACLAILDNPEIGGDELIDIVPAPDFPTGGEIVGRAGFRQAMLTGRGSVIIRGVSTVEEIRKDRDAIIITELPYQVNKATLIERIAELVREKRVEGVSDLRDESDRHGMRVVVELKRDATPDVVLNQLYRFTNLQTSFGVNMLALNRGRPEQMSLKTLLEAFLEFREEVVVRRVKFELAKARDRAHVLAGLTIAVANIDEVIAIIRGSVDPAQARERLLARDWPLGDTLPLIELIADPRTILIQGDRVRLSDEQARAILALTLSRLTGLGREEIGAEAQELAGIIRGHLEILSSRERVLEIVRTELREVRDRFAGPRRSRLVEGDADIEDEDLIPREDMVVTVTHSGYVKRTPLSAYRTQRRGGRGKAGMATKEEDAVVGVFVASTHAPVLFFTTSGKVHMLKVWRLPVGAANTRGKAFVNLLPLDPRETIANVLPLPEDREEWCSLDVIFAARCGDVRRNRLEDVVPQTRLGKNAMNLEEGDAIVGVQLTRGGDDVLLTSAGGKVIRFPAEQLRVFSSMGSTGVRGIKLGKGDEVISMALLRHSDATPEERAAFLRYESALLAAQTGEAVETDSPDEEEGDATSEVVLDEQRRIELGALQQFILTVTDTGYGKRTSSHAYPVRNRGGQGVNAYDLKRAGGGRLVGSLPVESADGLLLMTSGGQLIRVPADQVKITLARVAKGVIIVRMSEGERVISVERLAEPEEADGAVGDDA